ncbi:YegP family protein [Kitasatospora misakiensis]|uniref:YegP family protein n=1 Tax=Kitasatospora misakiensis TaxID=67330 RepID=A0ABW0XE48_9ACTN
MDASSRGHTAAGAGRGGFRVERAPDGRYRWQLKAPNGRVVAVTQAAYETAGEAERGFDGLRAGAEGLTARITHVRDGIGWIWVVPGTRAIPEVRSSRAYERYATCQNAFRRFVVLLAKQPALERPERIERPERPERPELPERGPSLRTSDVR